MKIRGRSIRTKIIALLTVPLVGMIGLWAYATVLTVGPVLTLLDSQTRFEQGSRPATALVAELQAERRASVTHLSVPNRGALELQWETTNEALAEFQRRADGAALRRAASPVAAQHLDELLAALDEVVDYRPLVAQREQSRSQAMARYSDAIEVAHSFLTALTVGGDTNLSFEGRAVVELGRGRELLSQIDAILVGAHTGTGLEDTEPQQLQQLIGVRRTQYRTVAPDLPGTAQAGLADLLASAPLTALDRLETELLTEARAGRPVPIDMVSWRITQVQALTMLEEFELAAAESLAEQAAPIALRTIGQMIAVGVIGLIVVIGTLVASLRIGRSLIERLTSLRDSARELARRRLPDVVSRLRQSQPVDVAAEAPELKFGSDEIGEVGDAFNDVRRTAVASAVEESKLRHGMNEVFLSIARRSQTLLHRQLQLLDRMERRVDQPEELEQLFQLDHLTTRMRRHAENLVILAGGSPGRAWRNAVPAVDVIRGAVSEVEDYPRINTVVTPDVAIAGRAVGDLIHLLAELLENATTYSPPHTEVRVTGQLVPNGMVVEIEDRGLGMAATELAQANEMLASPPVFDPARSERLGLLVVAQIAGRLGVKVTLRSSVYGGVAAVALIPLDLIEHPPTTPRATGAARGVVDPGPQAGRFPGVPALALVGSAPEDIIAARHRKPDPSSPEEKPVVATAPVAGPPASDPVPDQSGPPAAEEDELPQRTSKRHLAAVPAEQPAATEPTPRAPEQVRTLLSSYQRGLARGREETETETIEGERRGTDYE